MSVYNKYINNRFGQGVNFEKDYDEQLDSLKNESATSTSSPDKSVQQDDSKPWISPEFAKGAQRGMSGGVGTTVLSGSIASGNPYGAAAGIGIMALEQDAQAKQADEDAKAVEAQNRKQAQLSAINNLISVSKGLGV